MRRPTPRTALLGLLVAVACGHPQPSQPTPSTGTGTGPAAAPAPGGPPPGGPPAAGARPGAPRRRQPPNPVAQDSVRRATVDSILRTIAGREKEPAGKVFKNVRLLKDMPAEEFLRNMDTNYGRGLGWTCSNCHVIGQFDADTKKDKRIAFRMQEMTLTINRKELVKVKELNKEYEAVTCVMCHKGTNEPKGTMAVPQPPLPAAARP